MTSIVSRDVELVERRGFAAFARLAWHLVEPTPLVWNWHMAEVCNHYEAWARGDILNLLTNIPPGHSKSTIASKLLYPYICTFMPEYRMIQVTYEMTTRYTGASLAAMRSPWYRARWGDVLGRASAEGHFYTKAGGYLMATTPGSKGTGYHAHGINVDDPIKADAARGNAKALSATLDRVATWWTETMSTRAADKQRGVSRAVLMQRLHEADLTGVCLTKGDWTHLYLPAKFERTNRCVTELGGDRRTQDGEYLDLKRMTARSYEREARDLGGWASTAAQAQLQQRPTPPGGATFRAEWFRRFSADRIPITETRAILSVDCSFKGGDQNDYVALEVWGAAGSNFLLYDSVMVKAGFWDTLQQIERMLAKWPTVRELLIEDAANGPAVIETVEKFARGVVVIAEPAWGGALAKAQTASGYYAQGRVCHLAGADWLERKERQLVRYPTGVRNDDDVAAGSQAINYLARISGGISTALAGFTALGLVPGSIATDEDVDPLVGEPVADMPPQWTTGFQRDPAFRE